MLMQCKTCGVKIPLNSRNMVLIDCVLKACDFGCDFHLDYYTYAHGELIQVWQMREVDDGEKG